MRRIAVLAVLAAAVAILYAAPADARGLYKGTGRISKRTLYNPFAVRLNGTIGWAGAYRAKGADYFYSPGYPGVVSYSVGDWQFGHYVGGGLEFNLGSGASIEPYGLYRVIEDPNDYRVIQGDRLPLAPGASSAIYRNVESRAYAAGANLRFYKNWQGGAAYMGLGGGYVRGEATWDSTGDTPIRRETQQDSGDFHLLAGLDFHLSSLSIGFEAGWRWSGLSDFNEFDGGFLGARAGIMFGEGD